MKTFLFLSFLAFFAVSCTSSRTPAARIAKNPKIFRALKPEQQALVEVGKIQTGMTQPAVFLAWGGPDRRAEGEKNGKRYEQWIYNSLSPVVVQSAWGGWGGPGWGIRRGGIAGPGWGPWGWNGGVGTDVAFIPQASSWVKFVNGRVESWQRGRPQ
jgi:hypothetical protein